MKPRRVFVTLEIETAWPLSDLRKHHFWGGSRITVLQAQANVARQKPVVKAKRRGKK